MYLMLWTQFALECSIASLKYMTSMACKSGHVQEMLHLTWMLSIVVFMVGISQEYDFCHINICRLDDVSVERRAVLLMCLK